MTPQPGDTTGEPPLTDDPRLGSVLRHLAAAPPLAPPLAPGTAVAGRYVVEARLGSGGMGVVYVARDRELERRVALKLHRAGDDPHAADRLLREARAMARLAHPNVLAVHEVGEHAGQVFLVAEWVDGVDLDAWLAAAPRAVAEVLAAFVAAGEGLAAAHAVGLVHRDFKPQNVLIGGDGRVRVADFGLARAAASAPDAAISTTAADSPASLAGAGTPGYMAPEQLRGAVVDARSDQFSFCVALRAALRAAPASRVPASVTAALARGLSEEPGDRFPDMPALLRELRPERARRRRRRLLLGGLLSGVAAASVALGSSLAAAPAPSCAAAAWQADEILPADRRAELARVFASQSGPYAAEAWPHVDLALGTYADELARGAAAACADTHVHGVQSAERLDRRMACLARARREFTARLAALAASDRATLEHAVPLATALPDLERCAAVDLLPAAPTPEDPDAVAFAERLAAARARLVAGDLRGARDEAEALGRELAPLADPARRAELHELAGKALLADHATAEARARFEDGYLAARASGDEGRAARLALALAALQTGDAAEHRSALLWTRIAADELARSGGDRLAEVDRMLIEGRAHAGLGDLPAALARYEAAEAALHTRGSPRPDHLAAVLSHAGVALEQLGRFDEAIAAQTRALQIFRATLGEHHPHCVRQLTLIGTALAGAGRLDEAEARYTAAISLAEALHGADHPALAVPLADLAVLDGTRGRYEPAISRLERVLKIHDARADADPAEVAATLAMLGEYHSLHGDPTAGLAVLDRALRLERATFGDDHARVAECRMRRAQVLADTGALAEARADQLAAAADLERTLGPDSLLLADSLTIAGDNTRALGDRAAAEPLLRRALAIWDRVDPENPQASFPATALGELLVDDERRADAAPLLERAVRLREAAAPAELAESRWQLARALDARDRSRALQLAARAREAVDPRRRAEIDAWLRARR